MKHVIWVDDQIYDIHGNKSNLCNSIVDRAYESFDIDIEPFKTYDEAYTAFLSNPTKWIAIILDVQNDQAEKGSRNDDYKRGRRMFEKYRDQHHVDEPYIYVFSGQESVHNVADDYFRKDHPLQDKTVYNKASADDAELMFKNINLLANHSGSYRLHTKYQNIINDLDKLEWSKESKDEVKTIIRSVEIDDNNTDQAVFNRIRKILESDLYVRLEKKGFMDSLEDFQRKHGLKENTITTKSNYIGKLSKERIPIYIQRAIHSLTEITNNGSHTCSDSDLSKLVASKHVSNGNAPYLLKACLYELLTIIHWEANI